MYLVKNGLDGSHIANSIVLIDEDDAATFYTTDNSPTVDTVDNVMSYNYGSDDFNLGNPSEYITDSMPNTDPLLIEISDLDWNSKSVSEIMGDTFLPDDISLAVDNGNNSFVSDVETDIIGNPRIYISGLVDIGPYELQIHQLLFSAEDIQSIFQDKLQFDYVNRRYIPVNADDIYSDLYNQFWDNESYREEFARESKVIIKLKRVYKEILFFSDKENIALVEYEAYYDMGSQSIIIQKTDETLGNMLSGIFDDGRYIFYFDETIHKLTVSINPTYNKGKSGKGNVVNSVRIGGTSILND